MNKPNELEKLDSKKEEIIGKIIAILIVSKITKKSVNRKKTKIFVLSSPIIKSNFFI